MTVPSNTVLCLMGPTATGKTDVAMALADRLPVALISVDSAMVYRGMDIGTAKPAPAQLARYPHALIDVRDPSEAFSVGDFVAAAEQAVAAALAQARLPVLVGGTMLYFHAFKEGLARLPAVEPAVRAALAVRASREGLAVLHAELTAVDPAAAARIHPNNPQRLLRALEVYLQSGRPISEFWNDAATGPPARHGWQLVEVGLQAERDTLHAAIERRFMAMLDAGLVDEVAGLRARGDLNVGLPAMRVVGYRQVWNYLDGTASYEDMCQQGIAATRQLARRQRTWLRGWSGLKPLAAGSGDVPGAILKYLEAVAIVPYAHNKGSVG